MDNWYTDKEKHILQLMTWMRGHTGNIDHMRGGCGDLMRYITFEDEISEELMLMDGGIVDIAKTALRLYPLDEGVQIMGLNILAKIASIGGNFTEDVMEGGTMGITQNAAQKFDGNEAVTNQATALIRTLRDNLVDDNLNIDMMR